MGKSNGIAARNGRLSELQIQNRGVLTYGKHRNPPKKPIRQPVVKLSPPAVMKKKNDLISFNIT